LPRSSRHRPSFCWATRSEKLKITASVEAWCATHFQLGATKMSFGPQAKVWPSMVLVPLPSTTA
jgi:hypothetical protein